MVGGEVDTWQSCWKHSIVDLWLKTFFLRTFFLSFIIFPILLLFFRCYIVLVPGLNSMKKLTWSHISRHQSPLEQTTHCMQCWYIVVTTMVVTMLSSLIPRVMARYAAFSNVCVCVRARACACMCVCVKK